MKAGILNVQWLNNYGAVLLAYAMQKLLDRIGVENEVIDFRPCELDENGEIPSIHKEEKGSSKGKVRKFGEFRKKFLRSSVPLIGKDGADKLGYDAFIVGSDTVWTPLCFDDVQGEVYFLDFAKKLDAKKIAWAASIGTDNENDLNAIKERLKERLNNFDSISVRERETVSFLRELTGRKIEHCIDPVLMLDKEDYYDILPENTEHKQKYIYMFTFDNVEEAYKTANELSKKTGLPIIANVKDVSRIENLLENSEDDGPSEFVERIYNAEYVITDSYHGFIYSVLAKKPFVCFSRINTSIRARNLLEDIGLSDHFADDHNKAVELLLGETDYASAYEKIMSWRQRSLDFVKDSLGM